MKKTNMRNKQEKKIRNNRKYKILGLLLIPLLSIIAIMPSVMAHCPLCTAATIVGVGVTRSLGWDDSIVGVFVGAMIVSSALWVNNILKKKKIGGNAFLRIGSITFATAVVSFAAFFASNEMKKRNEGKVLFNYQTMALTFGALILNALLFWGIFQ